MEKVWIRCMLCLCFVLLILGSGVSFRTTQVSADISIPTMTVHADQVNQTIDGFGASGQSRAQTIKNMAEPARSNLLDLFFDEQKGIGLTILRNGIGDGGKQENGTICCWGYAIPSIEPEEGVWNWSENDAQIWLMREARNRGVEYLMSSAWSPPYWMKTNNSVINGGSLRPDKYQAYADYLAAYVKGYHDHFGIDINGISPQNEPTTKQNYPSALWTGAQYLDFAKNYLKPTFVRDGINADIILGENTSWNENIITPTLNDPAGRDAVSIFAAHNYDTGFGVKPFPLTKSYNKKLWMTEVSFPRTNDPSIIDGVKWAKNINDHMTIAHTNAWLYWRLALNTDPSKVTTGEALININPTDSSISINKRFYTLGNFSKFVRPGYVNLTTETTSVVDNVYSSAFKDPATGQFAIVMINNGDSEQTLNVDLDGLKAPQVTPFRTSTMENLAQLDSIPVKSAGTEQGKFTAVLPPMSVTTYVPSDFWKSICQIGATTNPSQCVVDVHSASDPQPGNLTNSAPNATLKVDSTLDAAHPASKAVDGITDSDASRWLSASSQPAHTFDMEWDHKQPIKNIKIWSGSKGGANYQIKDFDLQTSEDGVAWTTVYSVRGNTQDAYSGHYNDITLPTTSTKYLRMNIISPSARGDNIARLFEIQVY